LSGSTTSNCFKDTLGVHIVETLCRGAYRLRPGSICYLLLLLAVTPIDLLEVHILVQSLESGVYSFMLSGQNQFLLELFKGSTAKDLGIFVETGGKAALGILQLHADGFRTIGKAGVDIFLIHHVSEGSLSRQKPLKSVFIQQ
jgi:hypothetical protein